MVVVLIAIGALDTVTKGVAKGLEDVEMRGWVGKKPIMQHCWNRPEYWVVSCRFEKTCWHSVSNDVKNYQGVKW